METSQWAGEAGLSEQVYLEQEEQDDSWVMQWPEEALSLEHLGFTATTRAFW